MLCSFIIPAHDEQDWIVGSISAIQRVARELELEHELIVVADACSDATASLAAECGAQVLEAEFRQIGASRNHGAAAARGDYLFFVDADTEVTTRAVELALKALDNGKIGGGSTMRFDGPLPLYIRIGAPIAGLALTAARLAGGCFIFCRSEAFEAVGGFDETLFIAEEIFLAKDLKKLGRFVIVPGRVLTSGRKARSHSLREVLGLMWRTFVGGKESCRRREGLDLWYGERRADPERSMGDQSSGTA